MNNNSSIRHEIAGLVKLAVPVSLTQLSFVGMSATDVFIAGKAGTLELAGMNLGANTWNMIILFFMGVGFATQPLVAKQFGARRTDLVKHQFQQSFWMCLGLGLLATIVVWLVYYALRFVDFEPQMLSIARQYLLVISFCALPMTIVSALRSSLEGMNHTRIVFLVSITIFLLNIPLDYVLVNGLFGLPALGGVGCAWATAVLMWASCLSFFGVLKWYPSLRDKQLFSGFEAPNLRSIKDTLTLGLPIGLSIVIEMSMFAGAGIIVAAFGPQQAGSHAVAITIASMSFMLYIGVAQGITIRASQFLGAENPQAAWQTIKIGASFNTLISIVLCLVFVFFCEPLIRLFNSDPEIIPLAMVLLYFGAAFQIPDSLQVSLIHALRAYQDTRSPPKYQFLAFLVFGLPMGLALSFGGWIDVLAGSKGMWLAMVISLTMVCILLLRRLYQFRKQTLLA